MGALPSFKAPLFGSGVLTASFADRPPVLGRKGAREKEGLEEQVGNVVFLNPTHPRFAPMPQGFPPARAAAEASQEPSCQGLRNVDFRPDDSGAV